MEGDCQKLSLKPPVLFFDDLRLADQLYATIVRSPHAHADIAAADTRAALKTAVVVRGQHWRRKWLQVP
jgi:CO/xanthine dehydrogenase Mo-binding subunit